MNDQQMTRDDVELIARETLYQGYFRIDRYRFRHRRFDGGWTGEVSRELMERGHAAAVLLWDPEADEVVLIEQFRIGPYAAGRSPWQIEIVAGIIDKDEKAEAVARREAVEEAGLEIAEMVPVCMIMASPGALTESIALYVGRINSAAAGGVFGLVEEDEDIRVHVLPFADALGWVDSGRIENPPALIALLWLARHHADLKGRWLAAP